MSKGSEQNFPVEFFTGNYSDFDDQFTWLLSYEDDIEEITYSENILNITGFESAGLRGMRGKWNSLIYEDDRELVRNKFSELFSNLSSSGYIVDYRVTNKINQLLWVRETVKTERSPSGKLRNAYGIIKNITDLKYNETKLRDEVRKLEEANYSKDDFIAILSHDLRSPFTSILGFSEILVNETALPDSEKIEYLNLIHSSSAKQLKLVNNLLDWARLRTGRTHLDLSKVSARNSIYHTVSALTGEAVRKNIEIKVYIPDTLFVEVDEILFSKVILNLLENAIKYSGEGKNIELNTSPFNDKLVEFIVRDKGRGIPEMNKQKLFRINKIFSTQGTSGEKGTGLGLILCMEIIEKHGGDIWFFSEPEAGSEFHFTFPLFRENILMVGIDQGTSDEINNIFEEIKPSYLIRECTNGFEAIDRIKEKLPSLIILNHKMQLMDGLKFAEILQGENRTAGIPVCLIAEELSENVVENYNNIGINKIFYKPVGMSKLKDMLSTF